MLKNEVLTKADTQPVFLNELKSIIPPSRLLLGEPLARHTTFRIGGPADYLVFPASANEVNDVLNAARMHDIPVTVLGNGSNVLVLDGGIRGLVLKFGREISCIKHFNCTVTAGAGALLADVSKYAARQGLTGLEFAVGIPGSIGGAVFMNAGAYEGEISQVVTAATAVCADGRVQRFSKNELKFGYRRSVFQENGCIICEVELTLNNGENSLILSRMGDLTLMRETKQPLEMPCAGSTFKRPPGHFAGTLIEKAGLKGFAIGGAQVSTKHAGFIVNAGGATAGEVLALINHVQDKVYEKFGVTLQPEIRVIGEK